MSNKALRLVLGEEHFRGLVTGQIVEGQAHAPERDETVQIILSDIGYPLMQGIVVSAMHMDQQLRQPGDAPDLLSRLRAIEIELYEYSYGRDKATGERYDAWEEIASGRAGIERAIAQIEKGL